MSTQNITARGGGHRRRHRGPRPSSTNGLFSASRKQGRANLTDDTSKDVKLPIPSDRKKDMRHADLEAAGQAIRARDKQTGANVRVPRLTQEDIDREASGKEYSAALLEWKVKWTAVLVAQLRTAFPDAESARAALKLLWSKDDDFKTAARDKIMTLFPAISEMRLKRTELSFKFDTGSYANFYAMVERYKAAQPGGTVVLELPLPVRSVRYSQQVGDNKIALDQVYIEDLTLKASQMKGDNFHSMLVARVAPPVPRLVDKGVNVLSKSVPDILAHLRRLWRQMPKKNVELFGKLFEYPEPSSKSEHKSGSKTLRTIIADATKGQGAVGGVVARHVKAAFADFKGSFELATASSSTSSATSETAGPEKKTPSVLSVPITRLTPEAFAVLEKIVFPETETAAFNAWAGAKERLRTERVVTSPTTKGSSEIDKKEEYRLNAEIVTDLEKVEQLAASIFRNVDTSEYRDFRHFLDPLINNTPTLVAFDSRVAKMRTAASVNEYSRMAERLLQSNTPSSASVSEETKQADSKETKETKQTDNKEAKETVKEKKPATSEIRLIDRDPEAPNERATIPVRALSCPDGDLGAIALRMETGMRPSLTPGTVVYKDEVVAGRLTHKQSGEMAQCMNTFNLHRDAWLVWIKWYLIQFGWEDADLAPIAPRLKRVTDKLAAVTKSEITVSPSDVTVLLMPEGRKHLALDNAVEARTLQSLGAYAADKESADTFTNKVKWIEAAKLDVDDKHTAAVVVTLAHHSSEIDVLLDRTPVEHAVDLKNISLLVWCRNPTLYADTKERPDPSMDLMWPRETSFSMDLTATVWGY